MLSPVYVPAEGRIDTLFAVLGVTAFQKAVGYTMTMWGSTVAAVTVLAFSEGVNALLLGVLGGLGVTMLFSVRRLIILMIKIGEAAAEKKLRELASGKTLLTEEEVKSIVVEEKVEGFSDPTAN